MYLCDALVPKSLESPLDVNCPFLRAQRYGKPRTTTDIVKHFANFQECNLLIINKLKVFLKKTIKKFGSNEKSYNFTKQLNH